MNQATTVDFAAVARVSRLAELNEVRLIEVAANADPKADPKPLKADFSHDASVSSRTEELLEVVLNYRFAGVDATAKIINIQIKYMVVYALSKSSEPLAESDVSQFAMANGTLHSWPFVREFLHSLTYRMGFPPFKLGVMHFVPQRQSEKAPEKQQDVAQEVK